MAKFDIAGSMNGIMSDPSYQAVFLKTAAKKDDKEKADKEKEKEKADKAKEKEKADKLKAKEKADKEKAKEKADKEKAKAKAKKSGYEVCFRGLAKISEMLDDAGFDKAASYSLLALDSLVKKAEEVYETGPGEIGFENLDKNKNNSIDEEEDPALKLDKSFSEEGYNSNLFDDEAHNVNWKKPDSNSVDEINLPEMNVSNEKTDEELLNELLGDTETGDEGFEFNFEPEADDSLKADDAVVTATAISSLEKMAADLRVILAKKKKDEEEDKKGKDKKKDEKKNPFDKKNPFGKKDEKKPAKKDEKKDKKDDKQDAKKCKKAAWDFLA
jgi:hypothetical protein